MGLSTAAWVLAACCRSAGGSGSASLAQLCWCCHAQSHPLCNLQSQNPYRHHAVTEPASGSLRLEKTSADLTIALGWSDDLCTDTYDRSVWRVTLTQSAGLLVPAMGMQWNTAQETGNSHWAVSEASVLFFLASFSAHCHLRALCFLFTSMNSWASR